MAKNTPERIIDYPYTGSGPGRASTTTAGATSTATTLADHDHGGALGSGGTLAGYVEIAGDTMTGLLTLSAAPTADLHAATKAYVDSMARRSWFGI